MIGRVLSLCLVIGVVCNAQAQTITIKDSETEKPIDLVILLNEVSKNMVVTNGSGQADISSLKGQNKIIIRRLGYKSEVKSFAEIENSDFKIELVASSTQFDEVVISASRWSQSSRNVPSKIAKISAGNIALNNPQTAADLLATTGEVFIQKSQQGGGSPMIRGFAANRLLYTVDGVRMNSAIFRSGNIQNVISLDPFAIESAEIFFGPGSIVYGSDAIGGVMSFQTLTPQLKVNEQSSVKVKTASRFSSANNEFTNHFDLGIGWKKWASVTSVSHSIFGNLKMGKYGPDEYLKRFYVRRINNIDEVVDNPDPRIQNPSGFSQTNLMQKIRFSPTEEWDFQYGIHYSQTSEFSRYDRLIETQPNGLPQSAIWNYGPQIWMMNNLSATHKGENRVYDNMTFRFAQQYFEESRIDRNFSGEQRFRLRTNLESVLAYSFNLDFEKNINKHRLFYGIEYVLNDVTSKGSAEDIRNGSAIIVPDRYPASKWNSNAGYFNYQYMISQHLLIQAGVRHSFFRIESDFTRHLKFFSFDFTQSTIRNAATTGSLGLVYSPDETWKISTNASTGFRAPNVDDIGKIFDFAAGEVVVPNASLEAEYAYNGELNISKIFGDMVKLDVTGFYTYLNNAMVRRSFQVNGQDSIMYGGELSKVYAIQNAASAKVYGLNFGIDFKLPVGLGLVSNYNYQIGKEEMENGESGRSRHAAPAFGITRLTYQKDELLLQFYAVYSEAVAYKNLNQEERQKPVIYAKDGDGNPYSPKWYTLNLKVICQLHKNLSVSAGLENITDQRYRPYSSGLVAPGRNFIFSLRTNF